MANTIRVTISELQSAAQKLSQACESYRSAAASLKSAADALAATWEGDSQVTFAAEQEQANAWYNKMAEIVDAYVAQLNKAAEDYATADAEGATLINSK
jgi:WXG100 family type VII secretion target